jgi:outer membrane protein OmpA-like peptidoglycan-associated protein
MTANRPAGTVVLAVASSLALAACGGAAAAPPPEAFGDCVLSDAPVAIVIGQRANSPAIPENGTDMLRAALDHAIDSETWLTLIEVDGDPDQLQQEQLALRGKNGPAREDERLSLRQAAGQAILATTADDPEADLLAALHLATRDIRAHADQGTIVVSDSGLSTAGALDYTQPGVLLSQPGDLTAYLEQQQALPDLTGITVVLSGIGDSAEPQPDLPVDMQARLIEHWTSLAEGAGASCVYVDPAPATLDSGVGLPAVSVVAVPEPPQPKLIPSEPLRLGEETVAFRPDSDQMIDPETARANLAPLADELKATGSRVELTGTTATGGTEEYRLQLSRIRAEAVKALLVDLGVPAERIDTRGVGINHPDHVPDLTEDGVLLPGPAAQNRAVFVTVTG